MLKKIRSLALFALVATVAFVPTTLANEVPSSTPNAVDESGTLTQDEKQNLNAALEELRAKADTWGAVLIANRLTDNTIDSLAEKTFRSWKLGRTKVDKRKRVWRPSRYGKGRSLNSGLSCSSIVTCMHNSVSLLGYLTCHYCVDLGPPSQSRWPLKTVGIDVTCRTCGCAFVVCRSCWHRQAYCSSLCQKQGYGESVRAAGRRYQRSHAGRRKHAARQRQYREPACLGLQVIWRCAARDPGRLSQSLCLGESRQGDSFQSGIA